QSVGCICKKSGDNSFERFFKTCIYFIGYCNTGCMDSRKSMVGELSLSHYTQLVVVCISRNISGIDCINHSKLSGNQSSDDEPCEIFTNRVSKDFIPTEASG